MAVENIKTEQDTISLSSLAQGQLGRIVQVLDSESHFGRRLQYLGFVKGSVVKVRQKAPFRDPVEYQVRGNRFCLRNADAKQILVVQVAEENSSQEEQTQ